MKKLVQLLKSDETGMILSAELVLIVTIGVLGMIVGINSVATSINGEMNDISSAFGAIVQSYSYRGMSKVGHASVVGSGYYDRRDYCDCSVIVPTIGGMKSHGTYHPHHGHPPIIGHEPHPIVPPAVVPCDNCPPHGKHGKLKPIPEHRHHHPHLKKPGLKHPPGKPGPKKPRGKKPVGPKFDK